MNDFEAPGGKPEASLDTEAEIAQELFELERGRSKSNPIEVGYRFIVGEDTPCEVRFRVAKKDGVDYVVRYGLSYIVRLKIPYKSTRSRRERPRRGGKSLPEDGE